MNSKLSIYDYLIFFLVLLITLFIGLYFGLKLNEKCNTFKLYLRKIFVSYEVRTQTNMNQEEINLEESHQAFIDPINNKTSDYLSANQSMSSIPIALSLLVSLFSSSSLLGVPAETYQYGVQLIINVLGFIFVPFIGAYITTPFLARLKIVTIFEYMKLRFRSEWARMLCVTMYLIKMCALMGIVIYGPATAFSFLTNLKIEIAIILIGALSTIYTTIGGLKAVIWTDVFQSVIMLLSMLAIIFKGTYDIGGFENMWNINKDGGRLNFFDFDPNPMIRQSFWSLVTNGFVSW